MNKQDLKEVQNWNNEPFNIDRIVECLREGDWMYSGLEDLVSYSNMLFELLLVTTETDCYYIATAGLPVGDKVREVIIDWDAIKSWDDMTVDDLLDQLLDIHEVVLRLRKETNHHRVV